MKKLIIFLIGPTATGKTASAVCLAKKINAEIISCDSMQIYKGMDIITSKPTFALRKRVLHHLVDIVSPSKGYDVSRYRREALKKIKSIFKRGKTPLFVGGTGLYISILIDGIFETKAQDKKVRDKFYQLVQLYGSGYLYDKLKQVDPDAAFKIHPNDTKRIIRSLEVFEITGKLISQLQKQRKGLGEEYDIAVFGLNMQRDELYKRIDARVEKMFRKGLVREVKKLLKRKLSKTACCAIGIKELADYFKGCYDLGEAKRLIKRNTRHYAKRQLTWFRKDKRIKWIEVGKKEKPQLVADRILKLITIKEE